MLRLVALALEALVLWLRLKNTTARYDLQRRIEDDISTDENQITALRARGDDLSNRRADQLRDRIVRAHGIVADIPAAGAAPVGGPAGGDAGREVRPANG